MAIVIIKGKVKKEDINEARKDHGSYIKLVVDTNRQVMTIGGEWHADAEKILLADGSKQKNLWGGGIDLENKNIDLVALINLRPNMGRYSQEILNQKTRKLFIRIVEEKFKL